MASAAVVRQPAAGLASGAHPMSTFPNCHTVSLSASRQVQLGDRMAPATYASPCLVSPLSQLQQAVKDENWERLYETRVTQICMRPEWSSSEERCAELQGLAGRLAAKRVLEIGSFCGVGALALAEALPEDGEVVVLESDDFVVAFGQKYQKKSLAGRKIRHSVGLAKEGLERLAEESTGDVWRPFDLVVVDADKGGMKEYVNILLSTPGLLSQKAVVCVDLTLYKGQMPKRYEKFNFPHRWQVDSGAAEVAEFRTEVTADPSLEVHESGSMLFLQRR